MEDLKGRVEGGADAAPPPLCTLPAWADPAHPPGRGAGSAMEDCHGRRSAARFACCPALRPAAPGGVAVAAAAWALACCRWGGSTMEDCQGRGRGSLREEPQGTALWMLRWVLAVLNPWEGRALLQVVRRLEGIWYSELDMLLPSQ